MFIHYNKTIIQYIDFPQTGYLDKDLLFGLPGHCLVLKFQL